MLSTPVAQSNASILMTLTRSHIRAYSYDVRNNCTTGSYGIIPPEQQMMMQQDPNMQKQIADQVASRAAEISAEVSEQYAQSLTPPPQEDPLVSLRKQEWLFVVLKYNKKPNNFKNKKSEMDMQKDQINDTMIDTQRLQQQDEIAQDRIQTQRDIAAMNAMGRKN